MAFQINGCELKLPFEQKEWNFQVKTINIDEIFIVFVDSNILNRLIT